MPSFQPCTGGPTGTPHLSPIPSPTPLTPPPATNHLPPSAPALGIGIQKADTSMSWGIPAGLHVRRNNDENLIIFRRAVGIAGLDNNLTGTTFKALEEGRGGNLGKGSGGGAGRREKKASGMYAAVLAAQRSKRAGHVAVGVVIYAGLLVQIVLGAGLTGIGPTAGSYPALITLLGAINTVVAGVLALIKGQGLAERLRHDQAEFRKLQDWIEQTEALLAVGVIGRNRQEVGLLVQVAFKKYNAAKTSEENNVPENWVRAGEGVGVVGAGGSGHGDRDERG